MLDAITYSEGFFNNQIMIIILAGQNQNIIPFYVCGPHKLAKSKRRFSCNWTSANVLKSVAQKQHFGHQITFTVVLRTQGYDTFQLQWIESW